MSFTWTKTDIEDIEIAREIEGGSSGTGLIAAASDIQNENILEFLKYNEKALGVLKELLKDVKNTEKYSTSIGIRYKKKYQYTLYASYAVFRLGGKLAADRKQAELCLKAFEGYKLIKKLGTKKYKQYMYLTQEL